MSAWVLSMITTVLSTILIGVVTWVGKILKNFISEQREQNRKNNEFQRSMQRAEINRYFRIVVEQGNPVSPEELSHLEKCYESYHANGGNGIGTVMYKKVIDNAKIVTQVVDNKKEGQ